MRSFIKLGIGLVTAVALVVPATASASFLVYRCGNNLCRINPDGSGQTQLTSDGTSSAFYSSPSLSTDGSHLAFLKGGSVYTSDGKNVAGPLAGSGVEAHMAPDGSRVMDVAASGFGANQILSFNLNGSGQTDDWYPTLSGGYGASGTQEIGNTQDQHGNIIRNSLCLITNTPPSNSCARVVAQSPNSAAYLYLPTLQPGGSTLAVEEASSITGPTTISSYNYTTGALIANVSNGTSDSSPTWSPDGKWIAFQRGTAIYKVPAAGGSAQLLVASGEQPTWGGPVDTTGGGGGGGGGTGTTKCCATRAQLAALLAPAASQLRHDLAGRIRSLKKALRLSGKYGVRVTVLLSKAHHGLGGDVENFSTTGHATIRLILQRAGKRLLKHPRLVRVTVKLVLQDAHGHTVHEITHLKLHG